MASGLHALFERAQRMAHLGAIPSSSALKVEGRGVVAPFQVTTMFDKFNQRARYRFNLVPMHSH